MNFRTELHLFPFPILIKHADEIVTAGSCFANTIGKRLKNSKFQVFESAFGTVYHPQSLSFLIQSSLQDPDMQSFESHIIERENRFFSLDFHSSLAGDSKQALLQRIKETLSEAGDALRKANWLFLTFGTAWAWKYKMDGSLITNCQKLPSSQFERYLTQTPEIENPVRKTIEVLRKENPELKIVLSVSPVRHGKDDLPSNALSKSILRIACHNLCESLPAVFYFPAFEIMLDDLRDYRFYADDLLHPSTFAESYIWEKFICSLCDANTIEIINEWQEITRGMRHSFFESQGEAEKKAMETLIKKMEKLNGIINCHAELDDLKNRLQKFN